MDNNDKDFFLNGQKITQKEMERVFFSTYSSLTIDATNDETNDEIDIEKEKLGKEERARKRQEWDKKTLEEKLDIIEKSSYEASLRDSRFPYRVDDLNKVSFTEEDIKMAKKISKKMRRSAEAFSKGYKGRFFFFKAYYKIKKYYKKIKNIIKSRKKEKDNLIVDLKKYD